MKRLVDALGFVFLDVGDAVVDITISHDADAVRDLVLAHPVDSTECLLLDRAIPPRIDDDDSIRGRQIQGLSSALERGKLGI